MERKADLGKVELGEQSSAFSSSAGPVVALHRLLWKICLYNGSGKAQGRSSTTILELSAELAAQIEADFPQLSVEERSIWVERWLRAMRRNKHDFNSPPTLAKLCDEFLPGQASDAYFMAMRSICKRYGITPSSSAAAVAHLVARGLAQLPAWVTWEEFEAAIRESLEGTKYSKISSNVVGAFFEVCQVLDLLRPSEDLRQLALQPEGRNAEFLLGHLFGFPTNIFGFDALFGGAGLMLATASTRSNAESDILREEIGGRSVLCIGPFGSGKTVLSLQFAVEVARKGGVALVIALEQTPEECVYALESIGIATRSPLFDLVKDGLTESYLKLSDPKPKKGVLIFLRPDIQDNDYLKFIDGAEKALSWMTSYPIRLLIVDPINALFAPKPTDARARTRKMFETAKRCNVNVWFTNEQVSGKVESDKFAENIADTVIHLGFKPVRDQQRRYVEVTKSRFQKESSGQHSFVISQGGISIYPSSAEVSRLQAPPRRSPEGNFAFGVPGIERLLGASPILHGDIITFAGAGKGKTLLGGRFLIAENADTKEQNASILISDYSRERQERFLDSMVEQGKRAQFMPELCALPTGFVEPGRVLHEIRCSLEKTKNSPNTRVLVTNLSRWEEEMPLINEDPSFGLALVALLRSYNVAAVIVCGDSLERGSPLRDTVFDQSDIFLQFEHREFKGRSATLVSAIKTRGMRHQRESFEVVMDSSGISLHPAPLFRTQSDGKSSALPVKLFLHAETRKHKEHNQRLVAGVKAILSPTADIADQGDRFSPGLFSMSRYSAIDEVQVLQIDEFQLPLTASATLGTSALHSFPKNIYSNILADRLPEFCKRVTGPDDSSFFAVPFYGNLSFFSVRHSRFEESKLGSFPESWADLASLCTQWNDEKGKANRELLFHCPVYEHGIETYNCLFFEILCSLHHPSPEWMNDLGLWFTQPSAREAARLFRTLCRKGYTSSLASSQQPTAIISRHWYNTLNQELSDATGETNDHVEVRPLFKGLTTAGEWYLAIPSYSASPEVGLGLIGHITSSERDTQRVELGVGLPTRRSYYQMAGDHSISRYFRFSREKVQDLLKHEIRRSKFRSYQRLAPTISTHLNWILELPDPKADDSGDKLPEEISRVMDNLVGNINLLLRDDDGGRFL